MTFERHSDNIIFKKINNLFNTFCSLLTLIIKIEKKINNFCDEKYNIAMFTKNLKLADVENYSMPNSLTRLAIHVFFELIYTFEVILIAKDKFSVRLLQF